MINSLHGKNFETHEDTFIEFHHGVNVIVGESDEGKSGIVRQIKWNAENRPQGDEYRNDQLDPKSKEDKLKLTEVAIDYKDTGIVTRARDGFPGGINHYQIDDSEPLRALRSDVPDEVREVTKMKDVNIQGQHPTEQYFLLADKPGQVAKEFNKVAGLTIMDKALAEINSQVRTCNAEIKVAENGIKTNKKIMDDTKWVDDAEKFAKKLMVFKSKMEKEQAYYDSLNEKVHNLDKIDEILARYYDGLDDALKEIESLTKEKKSIEDVNNVLKHTADLILAITDIDLELSATADIDKALKSLETLNFEREEIERIKEEHRKIDYAVNMLQKNKTESTEADIELINAQQEYVKVFKNQECPTCGRTGI